MKLNTVAEKILIEQPYQALRVNEHIFRETVYGIVKRLRFIVNHIELERQRRQLEIEAIRILDVGCGTGINVTIPLAIAGYSVSGLDLDPASCDRAKQTATGLPNIEFHCCLLNELQKSEPFHVVICSEVLEHLVEPKLLVEQIRNVLMQDGLLIATVPNGYGYFEGERFLEKLIPKLSKITDRFQQWLVRNYGRAELKQRQIREGHPNHWQLAWSSLATDQTHYQRFTPNQLYQLIRNQRFKIVKFCNNTFLAGNILGSIVRDWDSFLAWNGRIADRLPYWMCSDWMVAARRVDTPAMKES
jgi:2-polyprenyl-3-methyl-5-hydroxy-6-metoxy-1,4-benzoquinol methylase